MDIITMHVIFSKANESEVHVYDIVRFITFSLYVHIGPTLGPESLT